jgi:tetratricopeptide (TPR) repeat protein
MKNLKIVTFFALIIVLVLLVPLLRAQEDFNLFNEAMELRIQREWNRALEKYQSLKQRYPDSKYVDDAEFWSAYILVEQGKDTDAFTAYQSMKQKYPDSPWADDATMHQIGLAEKFVKQGQDSYKSFLTEELKSPHKNVKYQAALSLGKLGDERAIPVLKEMSNNGDRDMRSVGNSLLQKLDQPTRQDQPQLKPFPNRAPDNRVDKKNKTIKKPPRYEPQKQGQTPARKPGTKVVKPIPKRQPQRSTPPKTTSPKKKGKIGSQF